VYEAWSLILREEYRLGVLENGVLRNLFGPKKDEVTRNCRKLHNEKVYALYSSPNVIRMIKSKRMR
jgi:acyl-coenzyme A synthetase/AMP-(fatty) acid ligase